MPPSHVWALRFVAVGNWCRKVKAPFAGRKRS